MAQQENSKKIIILIVLVIVMIFVWMPKKRPRPKPPTADRQVSLTSENIQPGLKPSARKRSEFVDWGRNPFAWSRDYGAAELKLSGIIWDQQAPYAIISGVVVHIGEQIGGKTVKDIKPSQVILIEGANEYILLLE
ncbi:hypothetical protein ACFL1I_04900 [Candidatus Omnitrophota bacterium]